MSQWSVRGYSWNFLNCRFAHWSVMFSIFTPGIFLIFLCNLPLQTFQFLHLELLVMQDLSLEKTVRIPGRLALVHVPGFHVHSLCNFKLPSSIFNNIWLFSVLTTAPKSLEQNSKNVTFCATTSHSNALLGCITDNGHIEPESFGKLTSCPLLEWIVFQTFLKFFV